MYSWELTTSLKDFRPDDPDCFGLYIRLMVGFKGGKGAESFDLLVCTPSWISAQYAGEGWVWGRHMLIVLEYDFGLIRKVIESYIERCSGSDWQEVATKVSAIGAWEFEDYQP